MSNSEHVHTGTRMSSLRKSEDIMGYAPKAGMDRVDKESVNRVVEEMSKGSRFFRNEERKKELLERRIADMLERLKKLKCSGSAAANVEADVRRRVDERAVQLESERDLSWKIAHVDLDAFFVSVELKHRPELRGRPVAVGGMGMLSASSYEARKYGVRSAMPGFIAKKLCPQLVILRGTGHYGEESAAVREILEQFDPNLTMWSLDEASLDLTDYLARTNLDVSDVASEIRSKVLEGTGLTLSVGVAPNRSLAKVCSDINKPNGQYILPNDRDAVLEFVGRLPCRKISGIGKVTEAMLRALGIETCKDLFEKRVTLAQLFSPIHFDSFLRISLGLQPIHASESSRPRSRSVSAERTFGGSDSMGKWDDVLQACSAALCRRLEEGGGRCITLKLKTTAFRVFTRSISLPQPVRTTEEIYGAARRLLDGFVAEYQGEKNKVPLSFRLLGVKVSGFADESVVEDGQRRLDEFVVFRGACEEQQEEEVGRPDGEVDEVCDEREEEDGEDGSEVDMLGPSGDGGQLAAENEMSCPVCGREVAGLSNAEINLHLDECISQAEHPEHPATSCKEERIAKLERPKAATSTGSVFSSERTRKRARRASSGASAGRKITAFFDPVPAFCSSDEEEHE